MPKNGWGGKRPGSGRKPKKQQTELLDRMSPYEDKAFKALVAALDNGEAWAVKLFFEYRYGKPTQTNEVNIGRDIDPVKIYFAD
jgi:hypothetical protein